MKLAQLLKLAQIHIDTPHTGRAGIEKATSLDLGKLSDLDDDTLSMIELAAKRLLAASEDFELSEELQELLSKLECIREFAS